MGIIRISDTSESLILSKVMNWWVKLIQFHPFVGRALPTNEEDDEDKDVVDAANLRAGRGFRQINGVWILRLI